MTGNAQQGGEACEELLIELVIKLALGVELVQSIQKGDYYNYMYVCESKS